MKKSSDETWNKKNIPQHNKGYILQTDRQHHSKVENLKQFLLKSGI
jgi:hypothetical protein